MLCVVLFYVCESVARVYTVRVCIYNIIFNVCMYIVCSAFYLIMWFFMFKM